MATTDRSQTDNWVLARRRFLFLNLNPDAHNMQIWTWHPLTEKIHQAKQHLNFAYIIKFLSLENEHYVSVRTKLVIYFSTPLTFLS